MNKIWIALICIIASHNLYAQKNFLPGWIITNSGDTLKGEINYRNWEKNPYEIVFRDGSGQLNKFELGQAAEFEITGYDNYKRMLVNVDHAPVRLDQLKTSGYKNDLRDTFFLRTILHGKKLSLYELVDEKTHFFLQKEGAEPVELIYKVYLSGSGNGVVTTEKGWQNQLKSQMSFDDEPLIRRIERSAYKASDLRAIIMKIDPSAIDPVGPGLMEKTSRVHFFAGAGIDRNLLDFGNDTYKSLDHLQRSRSPLSYRITAGMDIFTLRSFQKLFLRTELSFSSYHYTGTKEVQVEYTTQREKRTYDLVIRSIAPAVSVNYHIYRSKNLGFFLGAGASIQLTSYPVNQYRIENLTTGEKSVQNNYMSFEKDWLGINGQAGIQFRNIEILVHTMFKGGFSSYQLLGYQYKPTGLSLLYHFR